MPTTIINEIMRDLENHYFFGDNKDGGLLSRKTFVYNLIKKHLNKLDTRKVVAKEESLCPNCGHSTITKAIQIPVEPYGQSLKPQLPEDEKDKLIEQIECMQVELDWYKNKSQLPEKPKTTVADVLLYEQGIEEGKRQAREEFEKDYLVIEDNVSRVYMEITNGRISKWNTCASYVIAEYNAVLNEIVKEGLEEKLKEKPAEPSEQVEIQKSKPYCTCGIGIEPDM